MAVRHKIRVPVEARELDKHDGVNRSIWMCAWHTPEANSGPCSDDLWLWHTTEKSNAQAGVRWRR